MELFNEMKNLYLSERMSDCNIVVNTTKLPAHRIILGTKSEVFEKMFFGNMRESNETDIEIRGHSVESIKSMLKYIYSNEIDLSEKSSAEDLISLLKIGHQFMVWRLTEMTESLLIKQLSDIEKYIKEIVDTKVTQQYNTFGEINEKSNTIHEYLNNEKGFNEFMLILTELQEYGLHDYCETFIQLYKCALLYDLKNLLQVCHRFLNIPFNSYLIIATDNYSFQSNENALQFLRAMNVSNYVMIKAINKVSAEHSVEDNGIFGELIDPKKSTINELRELRKNKLLSDESIITVLENKCQELDQKVNDILKNYNEIKTVFEPFLEGLGGKVNNHTYEPSYNNCYRRHYAYYNNGARPVNPENEIVKYIKFEF